MHKHTIVRHMRRIVAAYIDPLTGEVELTRLAEATAIYFDHDEWLDDETHDVWDAAFEVAQSAEAVPGN